MLQIKDICKQYVTGGLVTNALDHVTLSFRKSEFVAILGPSGSGKTTLLNVIGGLDRYDSGDIIINGISTKKYKDKDWDSYRNHTIGFVFQSYNLIPHQSVLQNVELALTISNVTRSKRKQMAIDALEKVGLKDHIHKRPNQLSGGQMQRVAIARALVNNPDIILADEPTGALDSQTSVQVMDLLKEVAKEKLVIMVTHNPELADDYASRIVRVKDGCIVEDSQPYLPNTGKVTTQKTVKTKLGFFTALSLSLNNLMTKKGRTILTAFAGAIGIIGIAAILALSNGVDEYIRDTETDMLASYPLEIDKQTVDMSSMMKVVMEKEDVKDNKKINSYNVVGDTVDATENMLIENNIKAFKSYLEKNEKKLGKSINAIEYNYDIKPKVYRRNNDDIITVSPSNLMESTTFSSMMNQYNTAMMSNTGISTTWKQLVDQDSLRKQQYDLVYGQWPEKENEVALILDRHGRMTDYNLYMLGLLDIKDMDSMIEKIKNGEEYKDTTHTLDYKEAIGLEFKVFAPASLYKITDGVYVDKSKDLDYINSIYQNGMTVKVTCVLKGTDKAQINNGIGYDRALTTQLMSITKNTDVVKAQLDKPAINVFTGEAFEEETKTTSSLMQQNIPLASHQKTINTREVLYKTLENPSEEETTPDFSNLTPEQIKEFIDQIGGPEVILQYIDVKEMIGFLQTNYPEFLQTIVKTYLESLSEEELKQLFGMTGQMPSEITEQQMQDMLKKYMASLTPEQLQALVLSSVPQDQLKAIIMSSIDQKEIEKMVMANIDMNALIQEYMKNIDQKAMMEEYMKNIDWKTLMDQDKIDSLLAKYSSSSPKTYQDVLTSLSYFSEDEPSSISIYPIDFDGKEKIVDFIKDYNKTKKEDDQVVYNDLIGTLTKQITNIVDTISYVLIAFVAISLIVSSIMIAIITYISVLERTKEIGVLRALGASKGDISKIFNAETFIEGLMSGLFGVMTTWLLCFPINSIVENITGVANIAKLPITYALVLIGISVILTLIAGFLPSRMAAKKDPVTALRSE